MKVKFVSHASVIVTTSDAVIWSDPWLFGKAFNDSWSLFPEAYFDNQWFNSIDYIWISHEHPDHFHIPTLKSLPDSFKESVTILFQKNNSDKLPIALKKMGYKNIVRLPHKQFVKITANTIVWNYQVGQMDSILGICNNTQTVLNLNDAEINSYDTKVIKKKLGKIDILLNQFSMAGYNGYSDYQTHLPKMAQSLLKKVYNAHIALQANKTIPFASMIYFSAEDNKYINKYANQPLSVCEYFKNKSRPNDVLVMYPGDEHTINEQHNNTLALTKYHDKFNMQTTMSYSQPDIVMLEELNKAFNSLYLRIHKRYYKFLIKLFLKPMYIRVPDLQITFIFDLTKNQFQQVKKNDFDLVVYSQPLYFAMQFDWGFQTLGVSARCKVINNYGNYRRHRILFALNNAEIWLKFILFFNVRNLRWISKRFNGLLRQIKHRYVRQLD